MKKYRAVFFDLDHTLWDFDRNSEETLYELYHKFTMRSKGVGSFEIFLHEYRRINHQMWESYNKHQVTKEELRSSRFRETLKLYDVTDEDLVNRLSVEYLRICPQKPHVFPGAFETLGYLGERYSLHIITNGFREAQSVKLNSSGLDRFFSNVHISEEVGFRKPHKEIFMHAVNKTGVKPSDCIMVGDNLEADVMGAFNAGIDPVHFSPEDSSVRFAHDFPRIRKLTELMGFL